MVYNRVFIGNVGIHLQRGKHKRIGANIARNDIFAELWIERAELIHRYSHHIGNLLEMHATVHMHAVDNERTLGKYRRDIVLLMIIHYIIGGNERRHITASLRRQEGINFPKVVFAVFEPAQSLVHIAGAAVICGDSERPVVKGLVKLLEILRGRLGSQIWIAALVDE